MTIAGSPAPVGQRRRARARARRRRVSVRVGQLLVVVGAIAVIVSIFLKWEDLSLAGRHQTAKAKDVPIQFLFNYTTHATDPTLAAILAVSAALCLAGLLLASGARAFRVIARLGALLAIFTAVVYGFQVHQALHGFGLGKFHTTDFVGIAPYVAAGGGVAALVGSAVAFRKR